MTYDPIYVAYGLGLFVAVFLLLAAYLVDKFNLEDRFSYRKHAHPHKS